ncbi:hypothetical protein [Plantactinospora soyae]|uniref:Uncharacterized protein n=1 Tax=Plantactinospora soyae TaxID=1544732 RepID=A0A927R695_9ACTN|nr:hypothetical protein [Plantactinospora soyae]MBE1488219.1 hypothetical protein [Plantactinospora soyae]
MVIDLAAAADLGDTYDFAINELLAADARPTLVVADETEAKWGTADVGLELVPVVRYREPWTRDAVHSSHHRAEVGTEITAWDTLALSSLAATGTRGVGHQSHQQGASVR